MEKKDRIWIHVEGKSVVDHQIDAKKLAELIWNFQEIIYRVKPTWSRSSDYTIYVSKLEKGSANIGINHYSDSQNIHATFGIVNNLLLGINNANSSKELDKHLDVEKNEGLRSKLLGYLDNFWSNSDDEISLYFGNTPEHKPKNRIILNRNKKALFEKLNKELHTPVDTNKFGVLTALNSRLKTFELKTLKHNITGKYDKLPKHIRKEIRNYYEKPVKIYGKYDGIKKDFLEIYSINHSNDVEMTLFNCEMPENLRKAISTLLGGFENLTNKNGSLHSFIDFANSPDKEMIKIIEKLEDSVEFEYNSEKREDALWDYNGVLMLFLKKYNENDTKPALTELRDIFNKYVYYIILPVPEQIMTEEIKDFDLITYDSIVEGYIKELNASLKDLKKKYNHLLPTYKELRDEAGIIELDDELKKEIKKIL